MSAPRGPEQACLFCRIARRESAARILFETDEALAFEDVNPQAPVHALVIPKTHIASLAEAPEGSEKLLGQLLFAARRVAREKEIDRTGYRIVLNTGPDSGQAVFHIHFHVLGGRRLRWPPG